MCKKTKMWVFKPSPPRFSATEKEKTIAKAKELIAMHPKTIENVSRVEMRSNRIYLYELVEQFNKEGAVFTKPLINGKYLEYPYARITLLDSQGESCTTDFQRHNNQWMTIYSGTLTECITNIQNDDTWF